MRGSRRRARAEYRVRELLAQRFVQHVEAQVLEAGEFERTLDRIAEREIDPYTAVDRIFRRALGRETADPARPLETKATNP